MFVNIAMEMERFYCSQYSRASVVPLIVEVLIKWNEMKQQWSKLSYSQLVDSQFSY